MKLLDTYALASGAKIDKPFIFEQYFPLPFDKYITFQAQSRYDSKDYELWQEVLNILFPILDKEGVKIIQVGGPNENSYRYVVDLRGKTDFAQLSYIIKNAKCHLGPDSLGIHIASSYDIPLVGLYSATWSGVAGPHFGTKEKQILFDAFKRTGTGKPSYSDKEYPKSINLIKPEEIANSVLKLINLDFKSPFETFYVGDKYSFRTFREMVPTNAVNIPNPEIPIEIRMDLNFNEDVLAKQLSVSKGIIITNKKINKDLLVRFKMNIAALVYVLEEEDEPEFISDLKTLGIPITLMSFLPEEKISDKKINYYETGVINSLKQESEEKIKSIKDNIESLYFRSNKLLIEDNKTYMSNLARINGDELQNDFSFFKVKDSPEFWKELPFLYLVKKI